MTVSAAVELAARCCAACGRLPRYCRCARAVDLRALVAAERANGAADRYRERVAARIQAERDAAERRAVRARLVVGLEQLGLPL